MSRVINIDSTGKRRSQLMRTSAELIRHLSQKQSPDDDARDMAAMLVFCLREIAEGIEDSARAWERRDYWIKAERFRTKWMWPSEAADNLEDILLKQGWDVLPVFLAELLPQFSGIKIARLTRKPSTWQGAFARLESEWAT